MCVNQACISHVVRRPDLEADYSRPNACFVDMPAKTVLFDTKANPTHDLGLSPRNFLQYQPQSRLLLVAGFGNLSGHIDVWDRKVMKKVADIRAPNASTCEWSPCGTFIMSQSTHSLTPQSRRC